MSAGPIVSKQRVVDMKRTIFIGSSKEGLAKAKSVSELILKNADSVECVIWPEIFEPGSLTFEALEEMLMQCSAAVFVVTPDDESVIRGEKVKIPRANVMLEFGLVAGRLGRHNIALCSYGVAELPSDLAGLTLIKMDHPCEGQSAEAQEALLHGGEVQLRRWCSRVLPTTERVPRTEIVHGYSGTWRFELCLTTWRGLKVEVPDYAQVNGTVSLFISSDGQAGVGSAYGRLSFKFSHPARGTESAGVGDAPGSPSASGPAKKTSHKSYAGEFQVAHELQTVECLSDGGLAFSSRLYCIQPIVVTGHELPELAGLHGPPEPWIFEWVLHATGEPRVLAGTFQTSAGGITQGNVTATKDHWYSAD